MDMNVQTYTIIAGRIIHLILMDLPDKMEIFHGDLLVYRKDHTDIC